MVPKTPETRTPYVLALLAIIAAVMRRCAGSSDSAIRPKCLCRCGDCDRVFGVAILRQRPEAS